jgi:hypothetical protein
MCPKKSNEGSGMLAIDFTSHLLLQATKKGKTTTPSSMARLKRRNWLHIRVRVVVQYRGSAERGVQDTEKSVSLFFSGNKFMVLRTFSLGFATCADLFIAFGAFSSPEHVPVSKPSPRLNCI